jgi:hypothetical protein
MTDPTVPVARDLAAILDLAPSLDDQAAHHASDHLMPGGEAMVALAPVASPEANAWRVWTGEHGLAPYPDHVAEEDPDDLWPPLQLLLFWSEQWRSERGAETDLRPTLVTEATWLRGVLGWALGQHGWADFAGDVAGARRKLEGIVHAGRANRHGVRCLSCNHPLVRRSRDRHEPAHCDGHGGVCVIPHRRCPHDRGGLDDHWHCSECGRWYTEDDYRLAVAHAHRAWAEWLPAEDCALRAGVTPATLRKRASRGVVRTKREYGRVVYRVEDAVGVGVSA